MGRNHGGMSRMSVAARRRRRLQVFIRDGYRCCFCGIEGDAATLTVDHIVPYSKGGGNALANLQTACLPCNQAKADTMPVLRTA